MAGTGTKRPKRPQTVLQSYEESLITSIAVEDLFGLYTYSLGTTAAPDKDSRRLFLLYGDNGAGKTTVLQLLFSVLSRANDQGHRTYIGRTPFRRLAVAIGPSVLITIWRGGESLTGTYHVRIARGGAAVVDSEIVVDDHGKVSDQPGIDEYLKELDRLNIDLYFLTDDRKGRRSAAGSHMEDDERILLQVYRRRLAGRPLDIESETPRHQASLESTVHRFDAWVSNQALAGSSAGEMNTNTIYMDIIKRIARPRRGRPAASERDLGILLDELVELDSRSQHFAQYGLTSRVNAAPIVEAAKQGTPTTRRIVAGVLAPYVDGIKARLAALESTQRLLDVFVTSANRTFLKDKEVRVSPRHGLTVHTSDGARLSLERLSSGERQLLLLLCNTVLARDEATVFLVDEPELSLNIKWQRALLESLLQLTVDSPVQFIIATHSLELLARHKHAVRRLANIKGESA